MDSRGIVVAVKDAVVALAGYVSSYADKWAAEKAAKNVAGVRALANDIEVKQEPPRTVRTRTSPKLAPTR